MTDELIALIIRETGWSLEYVRRQSLSILARLAQEFQYLRAVESYEHSCDAALIVCALVSDRRRHYKPRDIVGERPQRRAFMSKKQMLAKQPEPQFVTLLDGKEYKLPALNLNVMADLEEEFDATLEEVGNLLQTRQMSAMRRALVVMLQYDYPDVADKRSIGNLVDMTNLKTVADKLGAALGG